MDDRNGNQEIMVDGRQGWTDSGEWHTMENTRQWAMTQWRMTDNGIVEKYKWCKMGNDRQW